MEQHLPLPPFNLETAKQKIKSVEDAWNSKNPFEALLICSEDSEWYSGNIFLKGHKEIKEFLTAKWKREVNYKLFLKYWAHTDKSIAVQFIYEYRTANLMWYRACGNETWEFDDNGQIKGRFIRTNDFPIEEDERQLNEKLVFIY
ncbi:DUF1348 family protein [Zobellia nedashkovskayae]|uniref:DUF1348 family protein n=1 Tax=Zobellia nedashkovskayae TaxID=2779510 RepID=UPI00188CB36B|nr:DUF1348 family protein [Zobellia nedashkovskayae]